MAAKIEKNIDCNTFEEEIDALKAIFGDNVTMATTTNNSLTKEKGVDVVYTDEVLEITFSIPDTYPDVAPTFQVLFNNEANEAFVQRLKIEAQNLLSGPMLFPLISTIRELSETPGHKAIVEHKSDGNHEHDKVQCKFFMQGKCRFGERCFNVHGNEAKKNCSIYEQQNTSKRVPSRESVDCKKTKEVISEINEKDKNSLFIEKKKKSMKTATDVIHRILWDDALPTERFVVGYLDRFVGIIEKPFTAFSWEDLASVDYNVLAVPKHRIQYFKYINVKVWDKEHRMDKMFGSTGHKETVFDIIRDTAVQDEISTANQAKGNTRAHVAKSYDERNRPNHFLCIRVTDETIKQKIEEVQMHIVEKDERLTPVLHDSDGLHITLCLFRLETDQDKQKAVGVLRSLEPILPCVVPLNSFKLSLRYLGHFRQRVVYVSVELSPELMKLADIARVKLRDAGVHLCGNYDAFSPHMTFLKLTRPFSSETQINEIQTFTFEAKKNIVFGKQTVDALKICETGPERGPDNFYITIADVQNNLMCISPKLTTLISNSVRELMRLGVIDETDGDEILEGLLSNDKKRFEAAVLEMEECLRGKEWTREKYFFILRGLPGSGKTFLSHKLKPKEETKKTYRVCSADPYFEQQDGGKNSYTFTGKEITDAHDYCRKECIDAVESDTDFIVIDNTHSQRWEYRIYERIALLCGYKHFVVEIGCTSESMRQDFVRRCQHKIKDHIHKEMLNKWESDVQAVVYLQHNLKLVKDYNCVLQSCGHRGRHILYSALFLDKESRDKLLYYYPATFKKVFADHMTIMYQPDEKHVKNLHIGEPFRVLVSGYYCMSGVQMVSLTAVDDKITPNAYPHVTISTKANIPRIDATTALESCACALPVAEIVLSGVVGVQISTGTKTSVKCFDKHYVIGKCLHRQQTTSNVGDRSERESTITGQRHDEEFEACLYTGAHSVRRIYIFDFDGTLFHTPDPVKGREEYHKLTGVVWSHRGWLGTPESLEYPLYVFPGPSLSDYWDHIDRACSYMVLCTGRLDRVKRGVVGVLKESGLFFDRLFLKPGDDNRYSRSNVASYKSNVVTQLLKQFRNVEEVKFWDDRIDNIEVFKSVGRKYPSVKFCTYYVQDQFNREKFFKTTTTDLFCSIGLRPSQAYQAAVREGMDIINKAWLNVLNVSGCKIEMLRLFGSYLLERRSDVDLCILAPKHSQPGAYLNLLADKLKSYGVKYVHCATGIRCPRLKIKMIFYNAAPVNFDIVMACVLDDLLDESCVLELRKKCSDEKRKIPLSGLVFHEEVVKPACVRLDKANFGMIVESVVILLKRWRLKGNAFHCIRTFHVVKLLADYLLTTTTTSDAVGVVTQELENIKDFEKFLRQVLKYFGSLSFEYLHNIFNDLVPDCYIEPMLECFQQSSTLNIQEILFKAPRSSSTKKGQCITLKLHGECPIMEWNAMSILEARLGTFIRQLIDRGFEVYPEETTSSHLSFTVQGEEPLSGQLKYFVNELQKEIETFNVTITTDMIRR